MITQDVDSQIKLPASFFRLYLDRGVKIGMSKVLTGVIIGSAVTFIAVLYSATVLAKKAHEIMADAEGFSIQGHLYLRCAKENSDEEDNNEEEKEVIYDA